MLTILILFIVDDYPHNNIINFFEETFKFIEQTREKTNVLVHCHGGVINNFKFKIIDC